MTIAAILILVGRAILGLFFVIGGLRNFSHFGEPGRRTPATNYGWTLPAPVTALGFACQIIGGLSVAFGVFPGWGAALLILFLISATELFHNFLWFTGEARLPHFYFTLVNLALCGYCLLVIGLSV
jgi:putative oxidoreductase